MGSQPPPGPPDNGGPQNSWGPPTGPPVDVREPPPPPRHPQHRGPQRPRDPQAGQHAARMVGRFALLVLASLVCTNLRLPWQAAAVLFSVPAVVVGILAVRAIVRAGMRGPLVVLTSMGVVMAVVMAIGQLGLLIFWPLTAQLEECQAGALTQTAKRQCMQDYERRLQDLTSFGNRRS
ncbi:MAG: hypothetical protein ACLGIA_06835 [Actinomycetes bacterium]